MLFLGNKVFNWVEMNLISHYSDMNHESAKFANVNVWFLKINLMRCPATRSHTILYTRNELILLTDSVLVCIVYMFTYCIFHIVCFNRYKSVIWHFNRPLTGFMCWDLVTNGPFVFQHKLLNSDRPSAVLRCWNVLINKKSNSPLSSF